MIWRVDLARHRDDDPDIFWVQADTAADAERIARTQHWNPTDTAAQVVGPDPDEDPDELWPRPQLVDGIRVHTFTDTGRAYDQTQYRPDIHDGDVLYVPSERVAGFLMQAWPTAVTFNHGHFHRHWADTDTDAVDGDGDGDDKTGRAEGYTASINLARSLLAGRPYTVTIAGPERHEGHAPYLWVVQDDTADGATSKALAAHLAAHQQSADADQASIDATGTPVYVIRSVVEGIPRRGAGAHTDARPGAAHADAHDCLAVEELRHRTLTWVTSTRDRRIGADTLAAEAAAIVSQLAAVLRRGLE